MPEFLAKKTNGTIIPLDDHMEEFDKVPDNIIIKVRTINPRSRSHQGLFFAAIKCALDNWPETHKEKFQNADHLRQWLECKAGYKHTASIRKTTDINAMAAAMVATITVAQNSKKSKKVYVFDTNSDDYIYLHYSQSIAYDKLSQNEFNIVSQRVSEVLRQHTGIGLDEFKRNMGVAA